VRVLRGEHRGEQGLDFVRNKDALGPVAILQQGLEEAAAVVFQNQVCKFVLDLGDGLIHQRVLFVVVYLLLFHHEFVVKNAQVFDQIGDLLLLAAGETHWFRSVLLGHFEVPVLHGGLEASLMIFVEFWLASFPFVMVLAALVGETDAAISLFDTSLVVEFGVAFLFSPLVVLDVIL